VRWRPCRWRSWMRTAARGLLALFDEYREVQKEHADMPSVQLQTALFSSDRGDYPAAEPPTGRPWTQSPADHRGISTSPTCCAARAGRMKRANAAAGRRLRWRRTMPTPCMHWGSWRPESGNREAALDWLGKAAAAESRARGIASSTPVAQHDFGDPAGRSKHCVVYTPASGRRAGTDGAG
jgi:hypothetical protein